VIGSRLAPDSPEAAVTKEVVARVDALNGLIEDVLQFARPPQPRPTPVDIGRLITATAELFGADPALKGVTVEVEGTAPAVHADAGLLKIVFVNLLVNAAHAMQERGTIRVSIDTVADACSIAIRDSGPGIPPDVREKIFTPFFTTKSRGTGLGLPTAKRLIEVHSGSISIDCPPHGGTTVLVRLPFHP
jgi:signal transduction histidine kinase